MAQVAARPRVALVLEGGGALGFAHIGVLEYLEQHHIPVDFVAGTSMGGLIGGLYAIGKSPAEIRGLTEEIDWDEVLSGRTAFQDLNFRRKEDRIAFQNALELGTKGKRLNFPAGLNSGHQTGLIIDRATIAYPDNLNFDDLPIPFRCVATDVTAGREKVFDRGSIARALRATMAIPGVFSPVVIDGHAFSDGGAVDNLPVDVAKRAGVDIVIAVFLDPGPVNPNTYDSMFSIAARNISIMVSANELRNMTAADILLRADLHGFTSASFKAGAQIIPRGYAAAEQKQKMLDSISVNDGEWSNYLAEREKKTRHDVPAPQFVEVQGTKPDYNQALKQSLDRFIGKPAHLPAVERTLTAFTGRGVMSSVGYTMVERNGQSGLEAKTYEKTYGPPLVNLGLTIDGTDPDTVLFGMMARLTFLDLGGYRSEWRNDAFFGSTYGVRSEYYRPLTRKSKWFFAPRLYAVSSPFYEYSGKNRTGQYRLEQDGFGADIGYAMGPRSELRIGEDYLWFKSIAKVTPDLLPNSSERQEISALTYRFYGADNVQVPRTGFNLEASFSNLQPSDLFPSFRQAQFRASYFVPVSKPASIFWTASGGSSFGADVNDIGFRAFTLGGPFRLGAFGQNQLVGDGYLLVQTGYERKLISFSPLIGEGLYAIGLVEAARLHGAITSGPGVPFDGSAVLAARTMLGPVFIGVSAGNGDNRRWWFGLGRIF
ncbi:MAG TPA: patatin-like phospholipase family protein [Bryobacteraceae bacterium]|jgi:NTE family protein|nr:patatin-like phospholipase family protein [Bryobacteraceae bacterium]